MSAPGICAKCLERTETKSEDGRYGKFLHIKCFNAWWKSGYGQLGGPYYRWMRQGMCAK